LKTEGFLDSFANPAGRVYGETRKHMGSILVYHEGMARDMINRKNLSMIFEYRKLELLRMCATETRKL